MTSAETIINKFHALEDELTTALVRIVVGLQLNSVPSAADVYNYKKKLRNFLEYLESIQNRINDARLAVLIQDLREISLQFEAALKFRNINSRQWMEKMVTKENELLLYLIQKLGVKPRPQISLVKRIAMVEQEMQKKRTAA